jgi:hypothetical protein
VPLKKFTMPLGIIMGFVVMLMTTTTSVWVAYPLLVIVGRFGYFVVPMNALLQHRGHVLMSAGHSMPSRTSMRT